MTQPIPVDLTKGGYGGDIVEESFKAFTSQRMSYWWHFREVLRVSQEVSPYWKKANGSILSDEEQRELIALSLLNYTVYLGLADAIVCIEEMQFELMKMASDLRILHVRRLWKSGYSSLYTCLNALSNIIYTVVGQKSPFGEKPGLVWNYTPKDALKLVKNKNLKTLVGALDRSRRRLEIRDHLDHYWVVWVGIARGTFCMDKNFEKGYVPLHPQTEVSLKIDASKLLWRHIRECTRDFNAIYYEMSVKNGFLDQYLSAKGITIDYSDYGVPHYGQRPHP